MESEGPYKVKKHKYWWCVDGLGEEDRLNQWAYKMGAEWWASQLNTAHAAGVKAERERNWKTLAKLCGVNPAERRPCIENVECKFWCEGAWMESEGPYKVEQLGARNRNEFVVIGPGWEKFYEIYTRSGAEKAAIFSNIAYSEGREAERERCLNVLKKYPDDWKVCGDILEAIRLEIKELI